MSMLDDLLIALREHPARHVRLDPDAAQTLAILAAAGRATVADRVRDADLIEQLADALGVALHAAREPEGVDPMAWEQANAALAAAGRAAIPGPTDHRATWLAKRGARGLGPF